MKKSEAEKILREATRQLKRSGVAKRKNSSVAINQLRQWLVQRRLKVDFQQLMQEKSCPPSAVPPEEKANLIPNPITKEQIKIFSARQVFFKFSARRQQEREQAQEQAKKEEAAKSLMQLGTTG